MSDDQLFPVPAAVAADAHINNDQYLEMYKQSIEDNEGFWGEQGKRIDWAAASHSTRRWLSSFRTRRSSSL